MVEKVAASLCIPIGRMLQQNKAEVWREVLQQVQMGLNHSQPSPRLQGGERHNIGCLQLYTHLFPFSLSTPLSLFHCRQTHNRLLSRSLHTPPPPPHTHTHTPPPQQQQQHIVRTECNPTEACTLVDTVLACFLTETSLLLHHIWCIHHFSMTLKATRTGVGLDPGRANKNMWLHVGACVHTSNVSNWLLHADMAGAEMVSVDCLRWECCCSSAASCELEGSDWACRSKPHSSCDTAQLYRVCNASWTQDRLGCLVHIYQHSLSHTGRD